MRSQNSMPPSNDDDLPQVRCQQKPTGESRLLPPPGNNEVAFPLFPVPEMSGKARIGNTVSLHYTPKCPVFNRKSLAKPRMGKILGV